jgi:two-component system, cell cycle sensor histidine kinase and response regulator CckA
MGAEPGVNSERGSTLGAPGVLIVDDDVLVLDVQRRIIERSGLGCLTASTGAAAVELLRERNDIRLVILDATLPDESSLEILKGLRRVNPSVRVIVCSGLAQDGPVQVLMDEGADGFLPKPFTASAFLEKMKAILTG